MVLQCTFAIMCKAFYSLFYLLSQCSQSALLTGAKGFVTQKLHEVLAWSDPVDPLKQGSACSLPATASMRLFREKTKPSAASAYDDV